MQKPIYVLTIGMVCNWMVLKFMNLNKFMNLMMDLFVVDRLFFLHFRMHYSFGLVAGFVFSNMPDEVASVELNTSLRWE